MINVTEHIFNISQLGESCFTEKDGGSCVDCGLSGSYLRQECP